MSQRRAVIGTQLCLSSSLPSFFLCGSRHFRVLLASCCCAFSLWPPLIASFPTFFFAKKPDVSDPEKWWRSRSVTQHTERITTKSRLTHVFVYMHVRAITSIFSGEQLVVVQIRPGYGGIPIQAPSRQASRVV